MANKKKVRTRKPKVKDEVSNTNSPMAAQGSGVALNELKYVDVRVNRVLVYQEIKSVYANGEVSNDVKSFPNQIQTNWL